MVFSILPANTESAAYEIENSLRFNDGDNPKLAFTPSSAVVAERKTFTISCWVKRGIISTVQYLWEMGGNDNADDRFFARFDASDKLKISDSGTIYRETNRLFRDSSAWYHIVVAVDTTDGTADNRVKVYVNGVQETSFATSNNPGQNDQKGFSDDSEHTIGRTGIDNGFSFDGYMADFNAVGGSQLAPTSFGETNDNGVWIPKNYTGSHGTNGFFLEFKETGTSQNSSGMGADTSGNDNHFAVTNLAATDITTDTPTNNFAVFRAHGFPQNSKNVLSEGNTDFDFTGDGGNSARRLDNHCISNIGVVNGKWYAEFKHTEDADGGFIGVSNMSNKIQTAEIESYAYIYTNDSQLYFRPKTGASESNTNHGGSSNSLNDIYQVALDMDNNNVYFGKNGSWASGSGAWNQSNPTSARSLSSDFINTDSHGLVVFNCAGAGSSTTPRFQANFGNAPFSISSGNADANGYGNFEYAVPSGYYSLCTKNLAEYG